MFRISSLTLGLAAALACGGVQAAPAEDAMKLLIEQGHFWQSQDNPGRAAEVWNKALLLDEGQPDALYGLGAIALAAGDLGSAKTYLARLQKREPLPRQALQLEQDIHLADSAKQSQLEEARLQFADGDFKSAAATFRRLLDGKPGQGEVGRNFYNTLAFNDADWREGRAGLERLTRENPDDSLTALFLAQHLARREATRAEGLRALETLSQHKDIGSNAAESWRGALTWMDPPGRSQFAYFERYLKRYPDDQEIRDLLAKGRSQPAGEAGAWRRDPQLERGLKALESNQLDVAERELSAYLKRQPKDADALGGLGILRQRQERYEDSELLLTQAVKQGGGRAWQSALNDVRYWSLLQRARENLSKDRIDEARQQLEQARRFNPKDAEALLSLADLQAQQGELAAAESGYRQALAQGVQEHRALRGLAQVLGGQGKADEALSLLEKMPKAEREKIGGLGQLRAEQALQRARLAEQRGDTQDMRQALESALRDDPNNAWARFALARLYVDMGAVDEARSLVDGLLVTRPNDSDALYTSALLSMQLGEWSKAQKSLARIPFDKRNSDIARLVAEVDFNLQMQKIEALNRSGRRAEARAFLGRIEHLADGKQSRQVSLASAYASAGDSQRAIAIMRDVLARSPRSDLSLTLSYAGVLLQAEQDTEVAAILRDVQGRSMTVEQRRQYDDLLFLYRVRQAEQLRERGELAAAYDTLAPALSQRPQDPLAVSALARMYAANGDTAKALKLFKPLAQRHPEDANLQVSAAGLAAQRAENSYATERLEKALKLAPNDVDVLTAAAGVYRQLGRAGTAAELLGRVVAQEKREQMPDYAASTKLASAPGNPFAGIGSQAGLSADIPAPVQSLSAVPSAAGLPEPASEYQLLTPDDTAVRGAGLPVASRNPFLPGGEADMDPRAGMSEAARALDDILQHRSPYLVQGVTVRSNDSESGLSKITDVQTPFEASMPVGDSRLALRVTPVYLDAGKLDADTSLRHGTGVAGIYDEILKNNPSASAAEVESEKSRLLAKGVGRQKDNGVGLAVAWESEPHGIKADIGVSPLGFLYSTAVGGISLERSFSGHPNMHYGLGISRRAVTDSLTSFAGSRDERSGKEWGGVTANGARAQLSFDNGKVGAYGYGSAQALLGNNVKSNTRVELGSGVYWYLLNDERSILTAGLGLTGIGYENNQGNFSYGSGGYFSPQRFYSLSIPVSWAHRAGRWTYKVRGSVGVQHFKQDSVPYFINDNDMQDRLEAYAANDGYLSTEFDGASETGIGYNLSSAAEFRIGDHFFLGGHLGVDNAQDYRQLNGGLYLRYMLEDMTGPMNLPVSPYQSPYSN